MDVSSARRAVGALLIGLVAATACAPGAAQPGASREAAQSPSVAVAPRPTTTLKIAWAREPESLHTKFYLGSGMGEYGWTFNSFLTYLDFSGTPHPMMAQEIPTRDNGGWVVNTDGTMVTTYRLRPNIKWH